jgi:hypothetical protein
MIPVILTRHTQPRPPNDTPPERRGASLVPALLALVVYALWLVASPQGASAQTPSGTFLSFTSQPGDYIGGGQSRTFTPADGPFNAYASQDLREVHVSVFPSGSFWFLDLAAPAGQQLSPGSYENAARWPFQAATQPGLSFSGDGRGCNTLTGRFQVLEASFGPSGYITRFHATFEQHCEGATAALFGEVQIVNPPPPPALAITITIDRKASVDRIGGSATVSGTISCTQTVSGYLFGTARQRANRFTLITSSFGGPVSCSGTPSPWSFTVSPSGGVPFNAGPAEVAVSASAFDPVYGVLRVTQASATVQLVGGPAR